MFLDTNANYRKSFFLFYSSTETKDLLNWNIKQEEKNYDSNTGNWFKCKLKHKGRTMERRQPNLLTPA